MILSILNTNIPSDTLGYFQNLNDNIDAIRNIVDVSNSTIANEISAVNTLLVVVSIIWGVFSFGVGIYITLLQNKMVKIKRELYAKEETINEIAKKVEDTDNKIQSDISGLYKQLREEETMTMLRRLEEEPQDISNLSKLLLARPIGNDGYPILKSAYIKLLELEKEKENEQSENDIINNYYNYNCSFLLLFFQHYMYNAILDNDIREDLRIGFDNECKCAFKSDIIKSTKDLCKALSKSDAPFEKEPILVDYLKAINGSNFKNLIELKNIFQEEINSSLLVSAIEKCTSDKVYLEMFDIVDSSISNENNK